MAQAGMAGDHRHVGDAQDVAHGVIGQVRDVDHDADAIHLRHDLLAERTQAAPLLLHGIGGVADAVVGAVGEGDVAHAAHMELRDLRQIVADRRTVLHAQRQRHAPAGAQAFEIMRRAQHGELVGMPANHRLDRIDLGVGDLPGLALGVRLRRGIDRHERHVEAALACLGIVELLPGVSTPRSSQCDSSSDGASMWVSTMMASWASFWAAVGAAANDGEVAISKDRPVAIEKRMHSPLVCSMVAV